MDLSPQQQEAKTALELFGLREDVALFLPDDLQRLYTAGYVKVRKLQRARRERLAQAGLVTVLCDIIMEAQEPSGLGGDPALSGIWRHSLQGASQYLLLHALWWWMKDGHMATLSTVLIYLLINGLLYRVGKWIGMEVAFATFPLLWKAWKAVTRR